MYKHLLNFNKNLFGLYLHRPNTRSITYEIPVMLFTEKIEGKKTRSKPFLFKKKVNSEEKAQEIQETQASQEKPKTRDDIHARRFLETQLNETEEKPFDIKNSLYKFHFNYPLNSLPIDLDDVNIINIENEETFHRIPKLEHHLEVILRKPGIYSIDAMAPLQKDGGKFLRNIPQPDDIDFSRIPDYVPPSKDALLLKFARESRIKYVMSTSTISNVLSQIYYLFSSFKGPDFSNLSEGYKFEPLKYMISQRKPTTNFLRKIDAEHGIYALDNDPGLFYAEHTVLMEIGKVVERSLTLPADYFNAALLKSSPHNADFSLQDDHHRFMKLNNKICLRSQIDCYSIDPETGKPYVFEIKTRSVSPIRYDLPNYKDYLDYRVHAYRGLHSSFEREYYDLIRGAFLKYAFQIRIGRMDGAFIAYHNTKEIFGFEYVKTTEIENRIFGNNVYAEISFVCCSKILIQILDSLLDSLKDEKFEMVKLGMYSRSELNKMTIFAELYETKSSWSDHKLIQKTEEIQDEFDYFSKYVKLTNKVIKYDFTLFVYINGVLQINTDFIFTEGDQIEIRYKFEKVGPADFIDYMNFLHDAYKFDTIGIDSTYSGAWVR